MTTRDTILILMLVVVLIVHFGAGLTWYFTGPVGLVLLVLLVLALAGRL
jgi:hypothetical protein